MPKLSFLMDDGVGLAAEAEGPESASRTVLLLHGAGQTRHSWRGTTGMLTDADYKVVSVDLRGHGESGWSPNGEYSLDRMAGDVHQILQALPGEIIVIGASLGGISALLALGEGDANNVLGLVLVDIVAQVDPDGAQEVLGFMHAHQDGFASVVDAGDAVAAYLPHRRRPANLEGLARNLRLGSDDRYYWHWDPKFLRARTEEAQARSIRMEAAAKRLDIPVLLVRGGESRVVTLAGVEEMLELIPHAEFVDIPGADHMVAGDNNSAFNAPLSAFLASLGR